ncbi:jg19362 [Pararge aegeria aegeria]|uniref:Jg19362 protein n=1 Tax=Pararge aegeria aegeria TaxID=348720 RepID=A0A8S4RAP4_9NEOP|nr:jg19362 [Pararge aegeria aegeria]
MENSEPPRLWALCEHAFKITPASMCLTNHHINQWTSTAGHRSFRESQVPRFCSAWIQRLPATRLMSSVPTSAGLPFQHLGTQTSILCPNNMPRKLPL